MTHSQDRHNRRHAAQLHPMLIVMVVPFAASCILSLPLLSQAGGVTRAESARSENVIVEQRERRGAFEAFGEAAPHDPPRHQCPWKSAANPPADQAAAVCAVQRTRFSAQPARARAADSFILPENSYSPSHGQRGPPAGAHI